MKLFPIIALVAFACIHTMSAQDNIIFTDGTELKAFVKEIGTEEVSYIKADNPNGPIYKVYKNTVFLIQFENGTSEVVSKPDLVSPNAGSTASTNGSYPRRAFGGEYRSPGMSFLFSFLMPGGGQYYNRQYGKGAAMTTLWLGGIITSATAPYHNDCYYNEPLYYDPNDPNYYYDPYYDCTYSPSPQRIIGNVAWAGSWIWSMIDAPISSARINRRNASAGTAGILDFKLNHSSSLHLEPFNSAGLGGAVRVSF